MTERTRWSCPGARPLTSRTELPFQLEAIEQALPAAGKALTRMHGTIYGLRGDVGSPSLKSLLFRFHIFGQAMRAADACVQAGRPGAIHAAAGFLKELSAGAPRTQAMRMVCRANRSLRSEGAGGMPRGGLTGRCWVSGGEAGRLWLRPQVGLQTATGPVAWRSNRSPHAKECYVPAAAVPMEWRSKQVTAPLAALSELKRQ